MSPSTITATLQTAGSHRPHHMAAAKNEDVAVARQPAVVDLCCGAGGFSCGFHQAGWRILLGADVCGHSLATFRHNLETTALHIDLMANGARQALKESAGSESIQAVIAGPPCQGFSRAGKRQLIDPRNDVTLAVARAAVALLPTIVILENVPDVMTSRYRQFFAKTRGVFLRSDY